MRFLTAIALNLLLLAGFTTALAQENTPTPSPPIILDAPSATPGGWIVCPDTLYNGIATTWSEDEPFERGAASMIFPYGTSRIGPYTHSYLPNKPLHVDYNLRHFGGQFTSDNVEQEVKARYFLLIDETFIKLDEENGLYYKDVILPARVRNIIPFEIPPLSEGIHSIIILGIPNFEEAPGWKTASGTEFASFRFTLVIGDPPRDYTDHRTYTPLPEVPFPPNQTLPNAGSYMPPLTLSLDVENQDSTTWHWTDPNDDYVLRMPGSTEYGFNVNMGQRPYYYGFTTVGDFSDVPQFNADKTEFAVIMLEDYEPVPLGDDTTAFYGEMSGDVHQVQIPVKRLSPVSGRRDIVVMRIDNPGVPVCQTLQTLGPADTLTIERVSVEAQE